MITSGASEKIDEFIDSLKEQKDDLNNILTLHNALVTDRTSDKIDIMCK